MRRIIVIILFLLPSILFAGPDQPFGPNPRIGKTYGVQSPPPYLHAAVDIHVGCNDSIFAIDGGMVSINWGHNYAAGAKDYEVHVGGIIYGHIDKETIPENVWNLVDTGGSIPAGTYIGKPSCNMRNARPGWDSPHIHLVFGDARTAYGNPLRILQTQYGLDCDYFQEEITETLSFLHAYGIEGSGESKQQVLSGGISIAAWFQFETPMPGWRPIYPYEVKWGVDNANLGNFKFDGELTREFQQGNYDTFDEIRASYLSQDALIWDLSKMTGSTNETRDLSSTFGGYWNTLQRLDDPNWQNTAYPCSLDTRKFPDGPHKVWVWARTYCGTVVAETVDVIIDNNPPQTEVKKVGDYAIKVTFSEPMDTTSFTDNIDIGAICRNMASVNIDSMKFSEDLTELTMFLPDTFPGNEAYHVELSNEITDITGTPLDGNANCEIDDYDNYDTIVGTGYCNYAFIVQTGGSTEGWVETNDYQDCVAEYGSWYCGRFNTFGGPNGWLLKGEYPETHATITATGLGIVFPYNNNYNVMLVGIPPEECDFSVTKNGNEFTWELTIDKAALLHYRPFVKVDPNKGRDYFTGITYIGFRHVQVYRYDFTCGSDLTVIDTLCMMYNVRQRDAIYRFENGMDIGQVGAFIGMHATLYSTDENPVITPVGSGRAKKYTGFTGGDAIELLKEDGNRYYSGGCGSDAPQGMYYIDDDCFLIADIPGVRAAIMNFGVDYGSLHDIAIALGMPASIIIGEEGSTRPNIPGNETEPQKKPDLPTEYSLGPPRPNPFNTTVCFDIELPRASLVDLRIYDILGRLVDTPINHTEIPAGKFTKNWACPNCPSGTYYIVFQTKDFHQSRKMTMVK
ncbi:hypothetical protein DRQ36_10005 [bacterium]|nr:MAG: hypothetical protein DRQ36_10005 [bacterium]